METATPQTHDIPSDGETLVVKVHQLTSIRDSVDWMCKEKDDFKHSELDLSRYTLAGELTFSRERILKLAKRTEDDLVLRPKISYQYMVEALLNQCWISSQNFGEPWNPVKPCRSCVIGDLYEYAGTFHVILSRGFVALPLRTEDLL